ncbi:Adenylyl-sulfate kinase [Microsporum ferrugineum]
MAVHLHYHDSDLTRLTRAAYRGQHGFTIWLTGISGSGKSTIAVALENELVTKRKLAAVRLDGDNIRSGLNKGLGFTPQDRTENIRRIGEVTKLFADSSIISITSFISPYAEDRNTARKLHALSPEEEERGETPLPFIEVFVDCPLEEAINRDKKGFYAIQKLGLISDYTGTGSTGSSGKKSGSTYEAPENPELRIKNDNKMKISDAVKMIIDYLEEKELLNSPPDVETAKEQSEKLVEAGQAKRKARLLKERDESAKALEAVKADADEEVKKAATVRAMKAEGALKDFYITKVGKIQTRIEDSKTAADAQALELKAAADAQALELKAAADAQASELKAAADAQASELKAAADAKALELKAAADAQALELKAAADAQASELKAAADAKALELKAALDVAVETGKAALAPQTQAAEPSNAAN